MNDLSKEGRKWKGIRLSMSLVSIFVDLQSR